MILNKVSQMRVLLLTNRSLQRYRLLSNLHDFPYPIHSNLHILGDFLWGWFPAQLLQQLSGNANQLVNCLYHMNWNSNGTSLIRNGTGNSLTNPPGSIGTKLIALGVVELLYSLNQTKIALLNQIQEQHTTAYISLGNTYYQAEIGLSQTLLSLRTILNIQLQLLHFLLGNSYQRNLQLLQISIILTMSLAVIILWIVCNAILFLQSIDNGIIPQHGSSYNAVIHTQLFA